MASSPEDLKAWVAYFKLLDQIQQQTEVEDV